MTATSVDVPKATLMKRLTALHAERAALQAESFPQRYGDDADRATNVDAHIRLATLDERIARIEAELGAGRRRRDRDRDDNVAIGDLVTIDLGEGAEDFLLDSMTHAGEGIEVITPGSPLGQALLGARIGDVVEYRATSSRLLHATVLAAA